MKDGELFQIKIPNISPLLRKLRFMYYVLVVGNKCFALLSRRFLCVKPYVSGKENIEKRLSQNETAFFVFAKKIG
ncbi:hypothetical protein, partial [Phocaeicola plebeius]|uniref:hypothetical protein n=1 Tax=Phocaeicola plebeius TaxID=310297 RepID=UPI003078AC86